MTLLFFIVRALYAAFGIRFLDHTLDLNMQYLDPALLKDRLLESIFYLHSQPPLFNFYLGFVLKFFPAPFYTYVFWLTNLGLGFLLMFCLLDSLLRFKVRPSIALVLTSLVTLSPSAILFENLLFYSYWEFTLYFCSAYFLYRFFVDQTQTRWLVLFFSAIVFLGLSRSMFHWSWFITTVLFGAFLVRDQLGYRKYFKIAIPFLLIFFAPNLKNYLVFDFFGLSSWVGMSSTRLTCDGLPLEVRQQMVAEGAISDISLYPPFAALDTYPEKYTKVPSWGIPVLDEPKRSTGYTNYNHAAYIRLSKEYGKNTAPCLTRYYKQYLGKITNVKPYYLRSGSISHDFVENSRKIQKWDDIFSAIFYWKVYDQYWLIKLMFFWVPFASLFLMYFYYRRGKTPEAIFLLYLLLNIFYFTGLSLAIECCENQRLRFTLDPFYGFLIALLLERGMRFYMSRRRRVIL